MNGENKRIKGVIKEDKGSVEREAIETTRKISNKKVNKGTRDGRRSGVEVRSVPNRNARLTLFLLLAPFLPFSPPFIVLYITTCKPMLCQRRLVHGLARIRTTRIVLCLLWY